MSANLAQKDETDNNFSYRIDLLEIIAIHAVIPSALLLYITLDVRCKIARVVINGRYDRTISFKQPSASEPLFDKRLMIAAAIQGVNGHRTLSNVTYQTPV